MVLMEETMEYSYETSTGRRIDRRTLTVLILGLLFMFFLGLSFWLKSVDIQRPIIAQRVATVTFGETIGTTDDRLGAVSSQDLVWTCVKMADGNHSFVTKSASGKTHIKPELSIGKKLDDGSYERTLYHCGG